MEAPYFSVGPANRHQEQRPDRRWVRRLHRERLAHQDQYVTNKKKKKKKKELATLSLTHGLVREMESCLHQSCYRASLIIQSTWWSHGSLIVECNGTVIVSDGNSIAILYTLNGDDILIEMNVLQPIKLKLGLIMGPVVNC